MGFFDFFKSKKDIPNNSELRIKLGDLKDIGIISHYKGKPFTGIGEIYYDSGQLETEVNFKNGKKEGTIKAYYKSGQLRSEGNFKNDKLEGISKGYYESGQLQIETNFKNDKKVSEKCWDEDGKVTAMKKFKSGSKKKLPESDGGELYSEGGTIENEITGESIYLDKEELPIYHALKGRSSLIVKRTLNEKLFPKEVLYKMIADQARDLDWFKKKNKKAYDKLFGDDED